MSNESLEIKTSIDEEEDFDELLESLRSVITDKTNGSDSQEYVVNQPRVQQLMYAYKALKKIAKGTDSCVSYVLHEPYKSMGSVQITGKDISFVGSDLFMVAVKLASNFEVYPKTNGTVQINFTFHGLTENK